MPSWTNLRIWFGVPSPVSATLPLYSDELRYRAAAATPTVVGEMMPLRFGCACSRPCVFWNDVWSSSLPYAVSTSFSPAYSGFASSVFMTSIHAFWLVALGVADRIAISPEPPIASEISFTWPAAISCEVAWLTKTSRASGAASESNVTTLSPCERARLERGRDGVGVVRGDHQRVLLSAARRC